MHRAFVCKQSSSNSHAPASILAHPQAPRQQPARTRTHPPATCTHPQAPRQQPARTRTHPQALARILHAPASTSRASCTHPHASARTRTHPQASSRTCKHLASNLHALGSNPRANRNQSRLGLAQPISGILLPGMAIPAKTYSPAGRCCPANPGGILPADPDRPGRQKAAGSPAGRRCQFF